MAGETVTVGLGIALDMNSTAMFHDIEPSRHYLELHPRSSLRAKGIGGGVGIIDIDYPDEIKIVLSNMIKMDTVDVAIRLFDMGRTALMLDATKEVIDEQMRAFALQYRDALGNISIKRGDKIGQLILKRHDGYLLPTEYTVTAERTGGFGSTG